MKTEARLTPSEKEIMVSLVNAPYAGLTRRELEVRCKRTRGAICARVGDLYERGLVFKDGKRFDSVTNRSVEVFRVTPE